MYDVQVEANQLAIQVQLRLIIKRVAVVVFKPLLQRPRNDVAQRVEIEVQIERNLVIKPDAFVINSVAAHKAKTERDDLVVLSPDKKSGALRHLLANCAEILFRQCLKF